jgi:hypothetical protein
MESMIHSIHSTRMSSHLIKNGVYFPRYTMYLNLRSVYLAQEKMDHSLICLPKVTRRGFIVNPDTDQSAIASAYYRQLGEICERQESNYGGCSPF